MITYLSDLLWRSLLCKDGGNTKETLLGILIISTLILYLSLIFQDIQWQAVLVCKCFIRPSRLWLFMEGKYVIVDKGFLLWNADREEKTFFKTLIVHTVMNLTPGKPKELKKSLIKTYFVTHKSRRSRKNGNDSISGKEEGGILKRKFYECGCMLVWLNV